MLEDYQQHDDRFAALVLSPAVVHVEKLWSGARWCEGPVYLASQRVLLWSDIPNNRILRWSEDGHVDVFRSPSRYSNGHTLDRQGRLVSCEHGGRRVTRTEHDGSITVLADRYQGKLLNSPNDVVVKSDHSVWFSDPSYGILVDYEGERSEQQQDGCYLFRLDADGTLTLACDDLVKPNGLAFSVDEKTLYVADTGRSHDPNGPAHIRRFAVADDGRLSGGEVHIECDNGLFDGFRIDEQNNLWTSAADGVHCYAPDATLLGKILIPEIVSNLCFGQPARNRLFITATSSVYSVYLGVRGAALW